jgi:nuclear pore complex protein Nup54
MLSGRQEEIWAKMSVLRDRAQLLKAETEKLTKEMQASGDNGIDEEQMKRVEKVSMSSVLPGILS